MHDQDHSHDHSHDRGHGHSHAHSGHQPHSHSSGSTRRYQASPGDMDKVSSTLKQFVRDWSNEVNFYLSIILFELLRDGFRVKQSATHATVQ
jgi:hypothetical protein